MKMAASIKKLRLSLCLEQAEFGKKIGVSASSVCNYELGSQRPRLPVIRKILDLAKANKIKMNPEDFIG